MKFIYIVAIQCVFGGTEEIYSYKDENDAEKFIVKWANENNPDNKIFSNSYDALEYFREKDANVVSTIQLFETRLN